MIEHEDSIRSADSDSGKIDGAQSETVPPVDR